MKVAATCEMQDWVIILLSFFLVTKLSLPVTGSGVEYIHSNEYVTLAYS
jgi:hypothetical protein